ncbi:MAG: hypothetical protein ACRCUM_01650 [Mycoplasmoidaceae bacterium]
MKKIIKLSIIGTLLSSSALAVALPISSCSSSESVLLETVSETDLLDVKEKLKFFLEEDLSNSAHGTELYINSFLKKKWPHNGKVPRERTESILKNIWFRDYKWKPYDASHIVSDLIIIESPQAKVIDFSNNSCTINISPIKVQFKFKNGYSMKYDLEIINEEFEYIFIYKNRITSTISN